MALSSENDWKTAGSLIPAVADSSWKATLGLFLDDLVSSKLKLATVFTAAGLNAGEFTFNVDSFKSGLLGNTAAAIANAWETSILASTMTVAALSYIGTKTPVNTFSIVTSATFDPASISLGKVKILELALLEPTSDPLESLFAVKFRDAFLMLTVSIAGTNSVVSSPAPLSSPAGTVI